MGLRQLSCRIPLDLDYASAVCLTHLVMSQASRQHAILVRTSRTGSHFRLLSPFPSALKVKQYSIAAPLYERMLVESREILGGYHPLRRHPTMLEARFELGKNLEARGEVDEATALYIEAVETAEKYGIGDNPFAQRARARLDELDMSQTPKPASPTQPGM